MPTIDQRLEALFDAVAHGPVTLEFVTKELTDLRYLTKHPYQRTKLREALQWAPIYYSQRRWKPWGSPDRVQQFLLNKIYSARWADPDPLDGGAT